MGAVGRVPADDDEMTVAVPAKIARQKHGSSGYELFLYAIMHHTCSSNGTLPRNFRRESFNIRHRAGAPRGTQQHSLTLQQQQSKRSSSLESAPAQARKPSRPPMSRYWRGPSLPLDSAYLEPKQKLQ